MVECKFFQLGEFSSRENQGKVAGIHHSNQLGPGIQIASITELGPGGSWSTCMIGCNKNPPQDVAHIQFHSRIAFKLVWLDISIYYLLLLPDLVDFRHRPYQGATVVYFLCFSRR